MQLVIRAYILFLALNVFVLVTNNLSDDEDVRHENCKKKQSIISICMRINELLRTSKKSVPFPKNQTRHASHLFLKVSKDFQVRGKEYGLTVRLKMLAADGDDIGHVQTPVMSRAGGRCAGVDSLGVGDRRRHQ